MNNSQTLRRSLRLLSQNVPSAAPSRVGLSTRQWVCAQCQKRAAPRIQRRGYASQPADNPEFSSIVDAPPQMVRAGKKHGWGLLVLGIASRDPFSQTVLMKGYSCYPSHCFRLRHMAGPAPGMEDRLDRTVRRSSCPRPASSSSCSGSKCDQRFRLSQSLCNGQVPS